MNKDVTIVLNVYKRPHILKEQISSVNNQTIKPKEIMIWRNASDQNINFLESIIGNNTYSNNNKNFGVWSRFAYALNAKTDWICIFDDDTIPGSQWIENCLETYDGFPGLLGTNGVIFGNSIYYPKGKAMNIGWHIGKNEKTIKVDIVGHSWFFHRDMLSYFFRELKPLNYSDLVGEDIHFSHMIQKYSNGKFATFVPPHPKDNKQIWGSLDGWGHAKNSISSSIQNLNNMGKYLNKCVESGYELIYNEEKYDRISKFIATCSQQDLTNVTTDEGLINV